MSNIVDLELFQRKKALNAWLSECKRRMNLKYPKVDFESEDWQIRTLYNTSQPNWSFNNTFKDFEEIDGSFKDVARCIIAEVVLKEKPKSMRRVLMGYRLLCNSKIDSIFGLTLIELKGVEENCLKVAKLDSIKAGPLMSKLNSLESQISQLARLEVIPHLGFRIRKSTKDQLSNLERSNRKETNSLKISILDNKIEAFNEAINALTRNDTRLLPVDRISLCAALRLMCAPSRINEILCSSIDDHISVDDYCHPPNSKDESEIYRAHQQLLVTMKGSKGAQWSSKPILNFMIDVFRFTTDIIKSHGKQSRILLEWYQKNPNDIYLPTELEYLRGKDLTMIDLVKITQLTEHPKRTVLYSSYLHNELKQKIFKGLNPKQFQSNSSIAVSHKLINFVSWDDAEKLLLENVRKAMAQCRKVTEYNYYEGNLSKMLFLFDSDDTPYLPKAIYYNKLRMRLKRTETDRKNGEQSTLFENLGITMPINGKVEVAWIDSHDPRRWLTTMALRHGEKLSDVLINKWANRLSLSQLKAYDFRTAEEKADTSRLPSYKELVDISNNLEKINKIEEVFGLKPTLVSVNDAVISMTSMNQVMEVVEDRPCAKTSEQIIILYPSKFGICLHQHHETPCRRYDPCISCNSNICVKGHRDTNEEIRKFKEFVYKSILRQLERLITTHNRNYADHPETLEDHLAMLVEKGLNIEEMAEHLVVKFHEIKLMIKDKLLLKRLEEGFVATGLVKMLDDGEIANGALMKYHNPTQHAAPGIEMALYAHGGRNKIAKDESKLVEKFPQFAPLRVGLKDQRQMISFDESSDDD